jgi:hypothetical protein
VLPGIQLVPLPHTRLPPSRLFVETEQRVGHSKKPSLVRDDDGSLLLLSADYHLTAVAVDGKPVGFEENRGGPGFAWQEVLRGMGTSARGIGIRPARPFEPGLHELTCALRIRIYQGAEAWNAAQTARPPANVSQPIITRSLELRKTFRISNGSKKES